MKCAWRGGGRSAKTFSLLSLIYYCLSDGHRHGGSLVSRQSSHTYTWWRSAVSEMYLTFSPNLHEKYEFCVLNARKLEAVICLLNLNIHINLWTFVFNLRDNYRGYLILAHRNTRTKKTETKRSTSLATFSLERVSEMEINGKNGREEASLNGTGWMDEDGRMERCREAAPSTRKPAGITFDSLCSVSFESLVVNVIKALDTLLGSPTEWYAFDLLIQIIECTIHQKNMLLRFYICRYIFI